MKIEQLKVGASYKFDNKKFKKEQYSCYGIDDVDAKTLFEKSVLIFSDVKYFYRDRGISNNFLGSCGLQNIGIYIKEFQHYNGEICYRYDISNKLWYVNLNFFDFLEETCLVIQEELDI